MKQEEERKTCFFENDLKKYPSSLSQVRLNFVSLLCQTNRFHVAVHMFSNRSQRTSKCGKNKKVTHSAVPPVPVFFFLPHFDIICDLLLNRCTATWNLFVKINRQ